ncbi:hypothetical protein [Streptomyces aurantiogriseus]|nr:hypothetical protein [Streptomyces aurantiogriseus]
MADGLAAWRPGGLTARGLCELVAAARRPHALGAVVGGLAV